MYIMLLEGWVVCFVYNREHFKMENEISLYKDMKILFEDFVWRHKYFIKDMEIFVKYGDFIQDMKISNIMKIICGDYLEKQY